MERACSRGGELCGEMSRQGGHGKGDRAQGGTRASFLSCLGISASPALSRTASDCGLSPLSWVRHPLPVLVPATGNFFSSSGLLNPAGSTDMTSEPQWRCPICYDNQDGVAYLHPCLHQFCLGCALRWVRQNPNCPLCRSVAGTIRYSVRSDDDYITINIPGLAEPLAEDHQREQGAAGLVPSALVGGFPQEDWVNFFQRHPDNINPLRPWLQWVVYGHQWWWAATVEAVVVSVLCTQGLDEEMLTRRLRHLLPEDTRRVVRMLITTATVLCGREIRWHLGQQHRHTAGQEDESPAASPGPSSSRQETPDPQPASSGGPAGSGVEEGTSPLETTLCRATSHPRSAAIPAEQEQPQEGLEQAVEAAGPSAQGCSRSPSTPGQGRDPSRGKPRRPPKRRASSPEESPWPGKRPPRRQH